MRIGIQKIVYTAVIAALAIVVQLGALPQAFTGPGVNAILYVASMFVGPFSGVVVGLVTPWIALLTGILKLPPAVPVIMLGNVLLALTSGYLARLNRYVALVAAAVVKWAAMTLGVKFIMSAGTKIPPAAYASLTVTQLFTALGGAIVAALTLEALSRLKHGKTES